MTQPLDYSPQGLPQSLGDGLIMRWATQEDTEALLEFDGRVFGTPDGPDEPFQHWLREIMEGGQHPLLKAEDFLIVVDEKQGGKLASTLTLASQTWEYDGVAFKVGQPEAVGTDEEYRRRGLVRKQMEIVHARSAVRGELVQVIAGIPWYYRQFGYGMGLDLGGSRYMYWPNLPALEEGQAEIYRQRPATFEDTGTLAQLYPFHCQQSMVNRVRDAAYWRYEMADRHPKSVAFRRFYIIENLQGQAVGYYEARPNDEQNLMTVQELGVATGQSWRAVTEFVCRALKAEADELNKKREKSLTGINFAFGAAHPVYTALGRQLERQIEPYALYVRVPNLPAFVGQIAPVLEKRLANSSFTGYSGSLKLNFFRSTLRLDFDKGRLTDLGTFQSDSVHDGDAAFPDLTFIEILFGRRSLDDLRYAFPDCSVRNEAAALLVNTLFPKKSSCVLHF